MKKVFLSCLMVSSLISWNTFAETHSGTSGGVDWYISSLAGGGIMGSTDVEEENDTMEETLVAGGDDIVSLSAGGNSSGTEMGSGSGSGSSGSSGSGSGGSGSGSSGSSGSGSGSSGSGSSTGSAADIDVGSGGGFSRHPYDLPSKSI